MIRLFEDYKFQLDSLVKRPRVGWPLATVVGLALAGTLHAQEAAPHGIPTIPYISANEQAGIDEDIIINHFGDIPNDPGPKAKLLPALDPASVDAAARKWRTGS